MNYLLAGSLVAAIVSLTVAGSAVPIVRRIAMAFRAVDYPGGRRLQAGAVPRIGGLAIAAGIAAGAGLPGLWLWTRWGNSVAELELLALVSGTAIVCLVGLADDLFGLSAIHRFAWQILAAMGVVYAGWSFGTLYVPMVGEMALGSWGGLVTIIWIVGVTNAINLLDGLDGLAGGVAAIIASSILMVAWMKGDVFSVVLMAALVGASVGFLRHNWAPARIYMGDSGSLTLGFLLAVMSLHGSIKGATAVAILVPVLALGLPVIDTLLVMAVRFVERPHGTLVRRVARMFQADRNHVHHLLAHAALSRGRIVVWIYVVVAAFCGMALVVSLSRSPRLGLALVGVELLVVFLMRWMGVRRRALELSLAQRREVREEFFAGISEAEPTGAEPPALEELSLPDGEYSEHLVGK